MKQKLFTIFLSFILILTQCCQNVYATTATEWSGEAVNGGEYIISKGKTVEINNSAADIYFENATLTIEEEATLVVNGGTLRFNQSTVNGTVNITGNGYVRPWGSLTKMDSVIMDGGTFWGADGASLEHLTLNYGTAEVFGTSVDEIIQNDGTLLVTDPSNLHTPIKNYTLNDGLAQLFDGGSITNATINGGEARIYTQAETKRAGSIDHVTLQKMGYLNLQDNGATVNRVDMSWGKDFKSKIYPLVKNYGAITDFKASGGYAENFGTVTNVTLLDDAQSKSDVNFRNGYWVDDDAPGYVEKLTMEYGWFFNDTSSILKSATVYDGFVSHFSTEPIPYIELLASKTPGADITSPNGASLSVSAPSVIETLKFAQGDLSLYDSVKEDKVGSVVNTLIKTDDFAGVISKGRFSEIKNELTGMATVSWKKPLNGSIKVSLDGQELLSGSLIADNSVVQVSVTPTDSTYKLKSDSLTANNVKIGEGSYTIKGDTEFSADFILNAQAQPWDGSSSITTPDTYEITQPIFIENEISICEGAEIYLTDKGSITIGDSGLLNNRGTIHGLVTLSPNRARMAKINLNNYGTIKNVKATMGTSLSNYGIITDLEIAGGTAQNHEEIKKLSMTQNGVLENYTNGFVDDAKITSGTLQNYLGTINKLSIDNGAAINSGGTIKNASMQNGKITNKKENTILGIIEILEASSGTIDNQDGGQINKLILTENNNVVLENKGTIQEQVGTIITGYHLDDNSITVTENAYFNKNPNITITWNPVMSIGSNTTAPVEYRLRLYENKDLSGEPIHDVTYSAKTNWGGASGSKLKHNTTYYLHLEAKVIGGNVEKDKVFTYQTKAVTTMPNPEEIGALNIDKLTLKRGGSFQFKAYDALGNPVQNIPLSWSVQAYPGETLTSKETSISKDGLLRVGIDENAKKLLVSCSRADGYLTSYQAIVTISNDALTMYPITINSTEGGKAWSTVDSAEEDAYVLLFSEANPGYVFDHWETSAGEIITATNETPFTRLRMPNEAVTITAHFVKLPEPDIDITEIDTPSNGDITPDTGDITPYTGIMVLLISSLVAMILLKRKSNKYKNFED